MKTATPRFLAALLVATMCLPAVPAAAATRGAKVTVGTSTGGGVRYPDAAYDPANNVFLAVTGKGHAQGAWISPAGVQLGAAFNLTSSAAYQQAPRVNCGESGNCLVVWHEGDAGTTPMGRVVSYSGGFLTAPFPVGPFGSSWEMGAGIAYSPAANEWLVTWMADFNHGNNISFSRVSLGGQVLATVKVTTATSYEREPNVAYNPTSNEFILTYAGTYYVNGVEVAYAAAQRVKDGALFGGRMILDTAKGMFITAAEYNPATGAVLVGWFRGGAVYGRTIAADGTLSSIKTLSSSAGAYDALDFNYNTSSESFLLVTHSATTVEDVAVEISSATVPSAAFTLTTNGGTGNFNPRVVSSTVSPLWLAVTANSFKTLIGQFATSTAGAGHCDVCTGGGTGSGTGGGTGVSISSLTPSPAPPVTAGTPITWTTAATGGTLEYEYWLYSGATQSWSLGRAYGSAATWTWTPAAAGTYAVQVWARQVGSAANYDVWLGSGSFTINPGSTGAASAVKLSANKLLPTTVGTTVTWTGAATGATTPEYQFWVYNSNTGGWSIGRPYNATPTFAWTPAQSGTYAVQVWARRSGSTANYEAWASSGTFSVTGSGLADMTSVTLNASRTFPMPVYTAVTFSAAANGPSPEYQFWLYNGNTKAWTMMQAYSASPTWLWIPLQKGTYAVQVWARPAGSTASYKVWASSDYFTVN